MTDQEDRVPLKVVAMPKATGIRHAAGYLSIPLDMIEPHTNAVTGRVVIPVGVGGLNRYFIPADHGCRHD